MKALVTGGLGGIGLHLSRRLLADGAEVDIVDPRPADSLDADARQVVASPAARVFSGDLREIGPSLDGPYDRINHLAALLGVQRVIDDPDSVLRLNMDLTFAALDIAQRQPGLDRFLFASTSEIYAGTLETIGLEVPTAETTPIVMPDLGRPRTSYMASKLYGEVSVRLSGLPATIIRPHNIYGPRMGIAHVIPQMLERAWRSREGDTFEVYSADHTRSFCYIDDAIEMICRLSEAASARGATVNVGSETPEIAMSDLAERIARTVGRDLKLVPQPAAQGSPARRAPDMSYCEQLTGFRSWTELNDGLAATFAWYRDNLFDPARNNEREGAAAR